MSETGEVLLGVIAAAVAIMAIVQVGAIIAGLRLVRRVEKLAADVESNVKPLIASLTSLTNEATRTARLAASQVERVDRLFTDVSSRLDQVVGTAQRAVRGPARDGMAIVAGLRAAIGALQSMREATRRRSAVRATSFEEEEESLFIG